MNAPNLQRPEQLPAPSPAPAGSTSTSPSFDPMRGTATSGSGGSVPSGSYQADFVKAEYLPASEPDPMTGKGGRLWPAVRFTWRLEDGRLAFRDTPANYGTKSGFMQTVGWLVGHAVAAGELFDLEACVSKTYLVTVGPKVNKAGQPTGWTEVTACILIPPKKA